MDNSTKDYDYYYRWTFKTPLGLLLSVLILGVISLILHLVHYVLKKIIRAQNKPDQTPSTAETGKTATGNGSNTGQNKYDIAGTATSNANRTDTGKETGDAEQNDTEKFQCKKQCKKILKDGLRDLIIRTIDFFLFEFEHKEHEYKIYGVHVRIFVLEYLFLVIMVNFMVCIISFWNTFAADIQIDDCHPRYDCFPLHSVNLTPIESTPMEFDACEKLINNENITIICFQLAYKYSEGLGEAGGLLFLIQLFTNILIYIVVRMVKAAHRLHAFLFRRWKKKICIKIILWAVKISIFVLVTTAFYVNTVVFPEHILYERIEFQVTLLPPNRALETWIYFTPLVILSSIPFVLLIGIDGKKLLELKDNRNGSPK